MSINSRRLIVMMMMSQLRDNLNFGLALNENLFFFGGFNDGMVGGVG